MPVLYDSFQKNGSMALLQSRMKDVSESWPAYSQSNQPEKLAQHVEITARLLRQKPEKAFQRKWNRHQARRRASQLEPNRGQAIRRLSVGLILNLYSLSCSRDL